MALLVACSSRAEEFASLARKLDPKLDVRVAPDIGRREDIRYALTWQAPFGLLKTLPNLGLVVSVGAGVDHLLNDPELPDVPMVRYVDPDLSGRMAEYVALHVLYHHRRMAEFRELQARKVWKYLPEPAAHEVRVGLMGLGVMGQAAARVLGVLGYRLRGWSRSPRTLAGVECFAGPAGLDPFLAETDILAVVLPLTPDTRGLLNAGLFAKLSRSRPRRAAAGAGADQCGPGRAAGRRRYSRGAAGGHALRRLPRRVRGRAAAPLEPAVVAPARRGDAAQRGGKRARGHRALRPGADARARGRAAADQRRRSEPGLLALFGAPSVSPPPCPRALPTNGLPTASPRASGEGLGVGVKPRGGARGFTPPGSAREGRADPPSPSRGG